jgi:hypothetical protein
LGSHPRAAKRRFAEAKPVGAPDQRSVMMECAIDLCGLAFAIRELSEFARDRRARMNFP